MISAPLCLWQGHMLKKGSKINDVLYTKFLYTKIEPNIYYVSAYWYKVGM